MKRVLLVILVFPCLCYPDFIYAHALQGIPYQAVPRTSSESILPFTIVSVRFTIRDSIVTGTVKCRETCNVTTTTQAMFSGNVWLGTTVIGTFSGIDIGVKAKFMHVELVPASGTSHKYSLCNHQS